MGDVIDIFGGNEIVLTLDSLCEKDGYEKQTFGPPNEVFWLNLIVGASIANHLRDHYSGNEVGAWIDELQTEIDARYENEQTRSD